MLICGIKWTNPYTIKNIKQYKKSWIDYYIFLLALNTQSINNKYLFLFFSYQVSWARTSGLMLPKHASYQLDYHLNTIHLY